jgi:hypothetical protein
LVGRPLSSNLNVAIGEIIRVKITIAGNAHAVQPEYDYKGNSNSIFKYRLTPIGEVFENRQSVHIV